jgi:hypothetical protein
VELCAVELARYVLVSGYVTGRKYSVIEEGGNTERERNELTAVITRV